MSWRILEAFTEGPLRDSKKISAGSQQDLITEHLAVEAGLGVADCCLIAPCCWRADLPKVSPVMVNSDTGVCLLVHTNTKILQGPSCQAIVSGASLTGPWAAKAKKPLVLQRMMQLSHKARKRAVHEREHSPTHYLSSIRTNLHPYKRMGTHHTRIHHLLPNRYDALDANGFEWFRGSWR